ncbi:MAG: M15 family metallopeptidase [Spirochaetaceae bacterium]|nr:M15 family metallopeptidase [Spirochaetaceae bacterium]
MTMFIHLRHLVFTVLAASLAALCSCQREAGRTAADTAAAPPATVTLTSLDTDSYDKRLEDALLEAEIPHAMGDRIRSAGKAVFLPELEAAAAGDPFLSRLVDKQHALPDGYEPDDLVTLDNSGSYRVGRAGLRLRHPAAEALERMAEAARAEGITLTASSAYRSYDYQAEVYARNVRESGQKTADRESSRPGYSQHQLGLAVDFGSITDAFAQTAAGRWIAANGPKYGWVISFPDGYEQLTGYRWESWHYRYMGMPLAVFIEKWFDGIQQYALQFIHAWRNY